MKKKLSILAVLVLAVAISAYSVGGTYAKYTSTFTGASSTARVAKWAFSLDNAGENALAENFTFNLFNTITDSDGTTEDDVDIDGNGSEHVIAPGTAGQFALTFYNQSEVNATYTISLSASAAGVPLEFKIGDGEWTSNLTNYSNSGNINMNGGSATVNVYWRWAYYVDADGDVTDTSLGSATTAAAPSATASITVTQVE